MELSRPFRDYILKLFGLKTGSQLTKPSPETCLCSSQYNEQEIEHSYGLSVPEIYKRAYQLCAKYTKVIWLTWLPIILLNPV